MKLPNWPPYNSHLTIWRRKAGSGSVPRAPKAAAAAVPQRVAGGALDAEWLLAPEGLASFLASSWCKAPLVLRATPARAAGAPAAAALPALLAHADSAPGALCFGRDVCASRYVQGVREDAPAAARAGAPADASALAALLARGYTLQVHQPQRFNAPLWQLCAALEASLGSLVGANVYVTPPGCQGLAPHYDDVDIWVLHTQGTKARRTLKACVCVRAVTHR